jgi:hypothetical protein
MRYEIRAVANADGSRIKVGVLDESDDVIDARELAKKRSHGLQYGAALIDTETGNIDFGLGWTRTRICPENPPIY